MDRTTTRRTTAQRTTTRASPRTNTARPTSTSARRTTTRSASRRTTSTTGVIVPSTTPSTTPDPNAAGGAGGGGGLSGGAIGGILAGVAVVFALVGLIIYKRRKRIAAEKSGGGTTKEEPIYMNPLNYSKKKDSGGDGGGGISGPLALTGDDEYGGASVNKNGHTSIQEPDGPYGIQKPGQVHTRDLNHNNQYNSGPRSPVYHQDGPRSPGAGSGPDSYLSDHGNNGLRQGNPPGGYDTYGNDISQHNGGSKHELDYHDPHSDYYGQAGPEPPIGAQRPPPHARDVSHGNLTPAPEYYLGKADIDPRRDLRGLDSPDAYVQNLKKKPSKKPKVSSESRQGMLDSPRTSFSSDGESVYLTLEQAQQAHHEKMMGHKPSVSSEFGSKPNNDNMHHNYNDPRYDDPLRSPMSPEDMRYAPEHASMAISDSTMSMMPSLPPINSPAPYSPSKHGPNGGKAATSHDEHSNHDHPRNGQKGHLQKSSSADPLSPTSSSIPLHHEQRHGYGHDDPYAESAYSEDYLDNRSMASSGYPPSQQTGGGHYNSPYQYPQKHQYPNSQYSRNNQNGHGGPPHMNHQPPSRGYGGVGGGGGGYQQPYSNNNGYGPQGYNSQGYNQGYQGNGYSNGGGYGRAQAPLRNNGPPGGGYGPPGRNGPYGGGGGGYGHGPPSRVASPAPGHRPRQAPPF
ncbi:hypothetical protein BG004_004800 [Podila humilis]|nr:hypothetical protein BG004_004800 [Podila humilis]